jgi:hypothetical protein
MKRSTDEHPMGKVQMRLMEGPFATHEEIIAEPAIIELKHIIETCGLPITGMMIVLAPVSLQAGVMLQFETSEHRQAFRVHVRENHSKAEWFGLKRVSKAINSGAEFNGYIRTL